MGRLSTNVCRPCWARASRHKFRKDSRQFMTTEIEVSLYVLVLAVPLGLELVRRVSPLLHTPLMSLTNAISAISVVGAILISGAGTAPTLSKVLGCVAV